MWCLESRDGASFPRYILALFCLKMSGDMYSGGLYVFAASLAMWYSNSLALSCCKTLDVVQETTEAAKESAKKTKAAGGKKKR